MIKMSDAFELPVNVAMIHNGDLCRKETDYANMHHGMCYELLGAEEEIKGTD